ncbi:MAG: hypothetical protein JW893_02270 [Candidatus Omnitrophica bacterium]|nr:hypothetical protein [Candidatus Omnitrophota bacterium]
MMERPIHAKFEEFDLPEETIREEVSMAIPTFSRTKKSKIGTHCYYFQNFKTLKGLCVRIRHKDIILPGLDQLSKANYKKYRFLAKARMLFQKYHYGFNFFEQIMLMTVPHCVTSLGQGRFIVSLWSYYGFLEVDCRNRRVVYKLLDNNQENHLFGSNQIYDASSDSLYYMTYSAEDSMRKTIDPYGGVSSRILKYENRTGKTGEVWSGVFSDYMHDLILSDDKRYLVVCDMGRFSKDEDSLIPSRLLVLDLHHKKEWLIRDIPNAAHVMFDPDDQEVIYFSNHNFKFIHTPFFELIKKGSYTIKFFGPASVHKYRITPDGPKEIGVYSDPELFRMTNFHIFYSEGRKIIAAMGAPNFIFIIDPDHMKLIRKIEIENPDTDCYIGTFAPSPDGKKLYIQTTRSFQVANISDGKTEMVRQLEFNHTCSNHMITSKDTDW